MNKTLLSTALVAVMAATAFAPTAQAANSGTITFSGKVLADTCVISVNGRHKGAQVYWHPREGSGGENYAWAS